MSLELSSDDAPDLETIVGVLHDDGCRRIVAVLEEPKTADEIAKAADLPPSTTYRKLDRLTEASLVTEAIGSQQRNRQKAQYVGNFDRITIDFDENKNLQADVSRSSNRATILWSKNDGNS
ncbi:DUF7342 family protein [Halopiger goleimassiliensis]|uniref:DUF7342 family protein n=1 Tax=Halopiger goleimassiliensis TaxID=1293048 RepID=UPI0006782032|nr:helix-turn-helix domain-containing protein [Halopiger goleimassiliensis]